jgi:hypothetical protein
MTAAAATAPARRRPSADELGRRVRARLAEQRLLVQALLRLRAQVSGSLFARYGRCGKEVCACQRGRGHGPYFVLSQRHEGLGSFDYLDAGRVGDARELLAASSEFRRAFKRLRHVNAELVVLLRRYQRAATRAGQRQLGLEPRA